MKSSKDIFYAPDIKDDHLTKGYEKFEIEADITLAKDNPTSLRKSITPAKISFLSLAFLIGFFIILSRIFALQVVSGQEYRQKAEHNRIKIENVTATRGIIYDKNNKPLVSNAPNFTFYFIPSDLPEDFDILFSLE